MKKNIFLAVILLAALGLFIALKLQNDEPVTVPKKDEVVVVKEEDNVKPVEKEEAIEEELELLLEANDNTIFGVRNTSSFTLTSNNKLTEKEVLEQLVSEPLIDFDVELITDTSFKITPTKALERNVIYKFSYIDTDFGKAFQTSKNLYVSSSYPGNDAYNIPLKSVIEINFNSNAIEGFEDAFSISPKVEGEFIIKGGNVIFMPEVLVEGTKYTVTINPGVRELDSERELIESYEFSFSVGYSDFHENKVTYSLINNKENESVVIPLSYWDSGNNYNVRVLKSEGFDTFKETYSYFKEFNNNGLDLSSFEELMNDKLPVIEYSDNSFIEVPQELEGGYYIIEIADSKSKKYVFVQVGNSHIYYANATNGELFWVINSETSEPIEGAEVYYDELLGETDSDGVLFNQESLGTDKDLYTIIANDFKYIINTSSNTGYYDNYYRYGYLTSHNFWSFLYTDRHAYQATDEINIFAFVRNYNDEEIINSKITLTKIWSDEVLYEQEVEIDEENTITTSLAIEELEYGYYSINLFINDELVDSSEVNIAYYEKPEILLSSSIDKKAIFSGESVVYSLSAEYFGGAPYSGLDVAVSGPSVENGTTNSEGKIERTINLKSSVAGWRPVLEYISARNNSVESTGLYTASHVYVFPKNVMVTGEFSNDDYDITLSIETNEIDISEFTGSLGVDNNVIKGNIIDRDLAIKVKEVYHEKVEKGTYYDPMTKVKRTKYDYVRRESYIYENDFITRNGKLDFDLTIEDDKSYEIIVSTTDKDGRKITISYYYSTAWSRYYNDEKYSFKSQVQGGMYGYEDSYKVGENVNKQILSNSDEIDEEKNDRTLFLLLRNGILDYVVSDTASLDFEFKESYRPNVLLGAIYYDGLILNRLPKYGYENLRYEHEELELEVKGTTNKLNYNPGEEVTLDVNVKDIEGNAFNGKLNISVVDEAFFAIYEDYFDIRYNLHKTVYESGIYDETMTSVKERAMDGAEGGEGGDGGFIRDDFKDTAVFKTIDIKNGVGSYKFNLPDNLTQWRITLHSINKELYYGSKKFNVNVNIPFFIRVMHNKRYNSKDDIYLNLRSEGYNISKNTEIKYTSIFNNESNEEVTNEVLANGKGDTALSIGMLKKGSHEITAIGEMGDSKDGIKDEFLVKDTYIRFDHRQSDVLTKDFAAKTEFGQSRLFVYNKAALDYADLVYDSITSESSRLEEVLSRQDANVILSKIFGSSETTEMMNLSSYQTYDGGIKALSTGNASIRTSALVAATDIGTDYFDKDKLISYLENLLINEKVSITNKSLILWALAKQEQPVLLAIDNFLEVNEFDLLSDASKINITLALLDLGDLTRAKEFGSRVLTEVNDNLSITGYRELLLARVLARRLEHDSFAVMNQRIKSIKTSKEIDNDSYSMYKVYDLKYYEPSFEDNVVKYSLNGIEKQAELKGLNSEEIVINQTDEFKILDIIGDIEYSEIFFLEGTVTDEFSSNSISIERKYDSENIQLGDIVKVTVNIKHLPHTGVRIYDIIPAGFEFVKATGIGEIYRYVHHKNEGNMLNTYFSSKSGSGSYSYYIMANQLGKYYSEEAVIQDFRNEELNKSEALMLEITEKE